MKYLLFLVENYESWGVKSILIGGIIALAGVVVYLYNQIQKLNGKILDLYETHKKDLIDANKDFFTLSTNFQTLLNQLKEILPKRNE